MHGKYRVSSAISVLTKCQKWFLNSDRLGVEVVFTGWYKLKVRALVEIYANFFQQ